MRMDDRVTCYRCGGTAHDLAYHSNSEMTLQCCYCSALSKIFGSPPPDFEKKTGNSGGYVLKYGRHAGSTISSIATLGERGVEYLRLLASESPKLKDVINEYLDTCSTVSVKAASQTHHPEPHRSLSRKEANISGSP